MMTPIKAAGLITRVLADEGEPIDHADARELVSVALGATVEETLEALTRATAATPAVADAVFEILKRARRDLQARHMGVPAIIRRMYDLLVTHGGAPLPTSIDTEKAAPADRIREAFRAIASVPSLHGVQFVLVIAEPSQLGEQIAYGSSIGDRARVEALLNNVVAIVRRESNPNVGEPVAQA